MPAEPGVEHDVCLHVAAASETLGAAAFQPCSNLYLFDRLLGASQFEAETPPQSPFVRQLVKKPMRNDGLGFAWDQKYGDESVLAFQPSGNRSFGLLAPSIHRVTPRLDIKLQIIGFFGQHPGADGEAPGLAAPRSPSANAEPGKSGCGQ
jgi:hypothetical protein